MSTEVEDDPEVRFLRLNGVRLTAKQLAAAAGVTDDTLTNYISKHRLQFASPTVSQGRRRSFCLIDLYQVALLNACSLLTANTTRCAKTLGSLLLGPAFHAIDQAVVADDVKHGRKERSKPDPEKASKIIVSFLYEASIDARNAQIIYAARDLAKPFYLFLLPPDRSDENQDYVHYVTNDLTKTIPLVPAALFVNATTLFCEVDRRLDDVLSQADQPSTDEG